MSRDFLGYPFVVIHILATIEKLPDPEAVGILERVKQYSNDSPYFHSLPVEKQEELLDNHFVPEEVETFYADAPRLGDLPEMFPKLTLYSGEKIVELDDKNYFRDEFSGPFCWETSSQSEFTFDKINEIEKPKGYRVPSPKLEKQKEKGKLWQSPFLANDRSKGMSSEALHLFEKFGLKLEDDDDEDDDDDDDKNSNQESFGANEVSGQNDSYKANEENIRLELDEDITTDSDDSPVTVVEVEKQFSNPVKSDVIENNVLNYLESKTEPTFEPIETFDDLKETKEDQSCQVKKSGFDFLDNW
ncbi:DgyrCDS3717 [Dimorphilus gyrociliatus]|uniref:DgyrCDS3717 n=1 Tax=Dimorphilus gyrociliatus TaxID=2664684 RepID=A0A7I8VJC4_9ANNE|nr:DgyrCDS3717 [Dimorphilus gyrociliatus]